MYGVITAMTTPFLENGEVNLPAVEELTEFLIQSGVNCLYPCGTTGEMILMTNEQRKQVAETVVKKAAGRVIVYIHVGAAKEEDTIELAKHAHSIGADGVGVVTPMFFGLTERELVEFYVRVSKALPDDFPMYLYNIPQCSTNDISAKAVKEIKERCKNVVGVKYSWADMHRTLDYLEAGGEDFSVLVGFDRLLIPALEIGCDGTVSGASSVFPEPFVEAYKKYQEGDKEGARKALWDCNEVVNKLKAGSRLGIFKDVQDMRGLTGGYMHKPLLGVTPEEHEELKKQFANLLEKYPR